MGRRRALAAAILFSMSVLASPIRAGECKDHDHDGFNIEEGCPIVSPCIGVPNLGCNGCGTLIDCNDASASTNPNAVEVCNGYDDNCNGEVDESPACDGTCDSPDKIGSDHRLTSDGAGSDTPRLAWNGSEFGVAWRDARNGSSDVYFTRASIDGNELMTDLLVSSNPGGAHPSAMVWNGSEYGVAWRNGGAGVAPDLFLARVSASGSKVGDDLVVTGAVNGQTRPAVVWTGSAFGLAWVDERSGSPQIYFARVTRTGEKIGTDVLVSGGPSVHGFVDIAWTGCGFGIVWTDFRNGVWDIYFARLSPGGQVLATDTRVTFEPGFKWAPKIVWNWNASSFGCVWEDHRDGPDGQIYFVELDQNGSRVFVERPVTSPGAIAIAPSLAWSGPEYGLAWTDLRSGLGATMFARVSLAGIRMGPELVLMEDSAQLFDPRVVWTGSRYGVSAYGGIGTEIYLSIVGCNCIDQDADGYTNCNDCDDARASAHPGAPEICNGADDDCDGVFDEDAQGLDTDADGIRNACDNCDLDFNPPQSDADHDGQGDRCDLNDGVIYVYSTNRNSIEWQQETGSSSWSVYEGDLSVLRATGVYTQTPGSNALAHRACGVTQAFVDDSETPGAGKVKFALIGGTGALSGLGSNSAGVPRANTNPCP